MQHAQGQTAELHGQPARQKPGCTRLSRHTVLEWTTKCCQNVPAVPAAAHGRAQQRAVVARDQKLKVAAHHGLADA